MISLNSPAVSPRRSDGVTEQQLSCPYRESNRGTAVRLSVAAKPPDGYKRAI
jgi:hypothetical protein